MRLTSLLLAIGSLFQICWSGCTNPLLNSSVLLSSPASISASVCPNITTSSCCTEAYVNDIENQYEQLKSDLKTSFTSLYEKYTNILVNLTLTATPSQIVHYLVNAYSFSKLTSNGDVFNNEYILATTDFLTDLKGSLLNWQVSYDTCVNDVMQHQAGLACAMCDNYFLTNFVCGDNFKIRWSVCNKLVHSCYQYLHDRVYITNLANIALTLITIMQNQEMFDQYLHASNVTAKYAIGQKFHAISYDNYKFPDECVDMLDCTFICKSMINNKGPVLQNMTNPTDLSGYNANFRRMLEDYITMKLDRENATKFKENYEEKLNRRMLQSALDAGNGIIFDVEGYDTYTQGKSNNTLLDNTVGIYTPNIASYASVSILSLVIVLLLVVL